MSSSLAELAAFVHRRTGIVFGASQDDALRGGLRRAAPGLDAAAFLLRSTQGRDGVALIERLVDELTIKETTFLRDRDQLDGIDWSALLAHASQAGSAPIRVWSAACATGEEAYSLAILASEALGTSDPAVDILGTDISGAAIAAAETGSYRERSLRPVDPRLRERYFAHDGSARSVTSALRRHVRFRRHNLVTESIPPTGEAAFDLIVCRNVLIYFDATTIDRVRAGLAGALRPGGTLVIGAADALGGDAAARSTEVAPMNSSPPATTARALRRPLGRPVVRSRDELLRAALAAAEVGHGDEARGHTTTLLRRTQLDADAHFVNALVELEEDMPSAAVASLRRALFADPGFGVAAFALAFAYDVLGDRGAARRAYQQALRTIDPADDRHGALLEQIDLRELTEACRLRLEATSVTGEARA